MLWRALLALSAAATSLACGSGGSDCDACVALPDGSLPMRRDAAPSDSGGPGDAGFAPDAEAARDGAMEPTDAGSSTVTIGQPGHLLIRGRAVLPMTGGTVYSPGEVYIEGDRVRCLGAVSACAALAVGATVIDTGGVVLPGLVDAHNHVAYDWLPVWMAGRLFDDSQSWRSAADYDAFTQPYSANKDDHDKFCAMVQWGEIRALVHGTTTIFGTPQPRTCYRWLVRNAELSSGYNGFLRDAVRSNTLGIDTVNMADAQLLVSKMATGEIAAYVVHLSEGFTARSHDEYLTLKMLGLLQPQTVIIHGAALTPQDFLEVGQAGAKLVWSPSSNIALYGRTTDVRAAQLGGVSIALAPDWTPSGTGSLLAELGFARDYLDQHDPGLFSDEDLVSMATRIPAAMLGASELVGTLEVGHYADVLVIDRPDADPYSAVVRASAGDVRLVVLGGLPVYGDRALLSVLPDAPADISDLEACGGAKRTAWPPTPDGTVSIASVRAVIAGFFGQDPYALVPLCPLR